MNIDLHGRGIPVHIYSIIVLRVSGRTDTNIQALLSLYTIFSITARRCFVSNMLSRVICGTRALKSPISTLLRLFSLILKRERKRERERGREREGRERERERGGEREREERERERERE